MAIISKIREKSTLLLITIGGALVLFVVSDLLDSNNSLSNRGRMMVGEINGEEIDGRDYEARVALSLENYKNNTQQKNVDESTTEQIRNQVWNQLVNEKVVGKKIEELGITISSDELYDMVQGSNLHPSVKQAFTDPQTGVFNSSAVLNFLKKMDEDETGQTRQRWLQFEDEIKNDRKNRKYNNLISKGLFANKIQAKDDFKNKNRIATAVIIGKKYISVADSMVKFEEEELKKYYDENKYKYKQKEESRTIEYVLFDIRPSQEDKEKVYNELLKVKEEFKTTDNDTALINFYSDNRYAENLQEPGGTYLGFDSLLKAQPGAVMGPLPDFEGYKIAKVLSIKNVVDSVKARHILLKTDKKPEAAVLAEADSLKKLLKGGAKFEELASRLSQDPGSAMKGGDLGWFKPGMMVKEFNDACFKGNVGDMPIVTTQFGVHLIEITSKGKESKKYDIGVVSRKVEPGNKTYQNVFASADQFLSKSSNAEAFDKATEEMQLNKRVAEIKDNQNTIPGIENANDIIGWAYNAEANEVSKVFELGKRFVVAKIKEINPKGYKSFESVQEEVTSQVRRIKKGELFKKEFESALSGAPDILTIAAKLDLKPDTVENIKFDAFTVGKIGREPDLLGAISCRTETGFTKPIIGLSGTYIAYLNSVRLEGESEDGYKSNYLAVKQILSQRAQYEAFEALKEISGVTDNRTKVLYQR